MNNNEPETRRIWIPKRAVEAWITGKWRICRLPAHAVPPLFVGVPEPGEPTKRQREQDQAVAKRLGLLDKESGRDAA